MSLLKNVIAKNSNPLPLISTHTSLPISSKNVTNSKDEKNDKWQLHLFNVQNGQGDLNYGLRSVLFLPLVTNPCLNGACQAFDNEITVADFYKNSPLIICNRDIIKGAEVFATIDENFSTNDKLLLQKLSHTLLPTICDDCPDEIQVYVKLMLKCVNKLIQNQVSKCTIQTNMVTTTKAYFIICERGHIIKDQEKLNGINFALSINIIGEYSKFNENVKDQAIFISNPNASLKICSLPILKNNSNVDDLVIDLTNMLNQLKKKALDESNIKYTKDWYFDFNINHEFFHHDIIKVFFNFVRQLNINIHFLFSNKDVFRGISKIPKSFTVFEDLVSVLFNVNVFSKKDDVKIEGKNDTNVSDVEMHEDEIDEISEVDKASVVKKNNSYSSLFNNTNPFLSNKFKESTVTKSISQELIPIQSVNQESSSKKSDHEHFIINSVKSISLDEFTNYEMECRTKRLDMLKSKKGNANFWFSFGRVFVNESLHADEVVEFKMTRPFLYNDVISAGVIINENIHFDLIFNLLVDTIKRN